MLFLKNMVHSLPAFLGQYTVLCSVCLETKMLRCKELTFNVTLGFKFYLVFMVEFKSILKYVGGIIILHAV